MFEVFTAGPPADWDPIPDEVLGEIGSWDEVDPPPAGVVPFSVDSDELIWQAVGRELGVETLPLVCATPFDALSDQGRSLALRRLDELSSHIDAIKTELTAAIAGPAPAATEARHDDFSPHEISVATRCSVYAADTKITLARDFSSRLIATLEAMHHGQITWAQARALSEATGHLDIQIAREIESKMLTYSHRQDLTLFKAALRRWVAKLDPDFTARATAARQDCIVEHTANSDGTGELFIRGPLEITTAISMALTAYAAKTRDELGGVAAQRKLAGLRDLTDSYLGSPDAPTQHGRPPTVNVTIDLATLLGLRDGTAEIAGVGALPASVAQWLLADGAPLRRLIIDSATGRLIDYGTTTYVVPPALADHLIALNVRSASPHSTVDAAGADMEHNQPYTDGGATSPINVTPIDRRWHRAKTHGGWTYVKEPDTDVVVWTSPTGLSCQVDPYDYRAG